MIEARELTKRYGDTTAVHSLSVTIAPGTVTGFLGPNGAGTSTTMRMIMEVDRPTSGTVTVNGKPYRQHRAPLREVGALLEASAVHPGRSARSHLRPRDFANCGHHVGAGPEPQDQTSSGTLLTWEFIGGAGGARTHDPGIMSAHALCAVLTCVDAA